MLPTKLQTLKLHFSLKMRPGRKKNSTVTPSKVAEVIRHYWVLAGYENVSSPKNKIVKLPKDYQHQQKYKNIKYKKYLEDRSKFVNNVSCPGSALPGGSSQRGLTLAVRGV